jgi:hypothetical protein
MSQSVQDVLKQILSASTSAAGALAKNSTFMQSPVATAGLTQYDLEPAAKDLYPVLSPLRNRIPRVGGGAGIQANWKSVTGFNTGNTNPAVGEGQRGGMINISTQDNYAAFVTLGLEDSVTFEADEAAAGFDDLKARATRMLLQAQMVAEENVLLGGNATHKLGTTPTPALTASASGGTIGASVAAQVACVALTYDGMNAMSMSSGVLQQVNRTNTDGSTMSYNAGSAAPSAIASVTVGTGTANSVTAALTPVPGAYGYAWFTGVGGALYLTAITRIAQYTVTALATSGQAFSSLASADFSANSSVHDGLLGFAGNTANNGAYFYAAANGAGLTADGQGGIVEFDTALQSFWDNHRIGADRILVSSQEMLWIRRKIMTNTSSGMRFNVTTNQGAVQGGGIPKTYLNPFTGGGTQSSPEIPIELHPFLPPGTVLIYSEHLPFPNANIKNLLQVKTRRDYYQIAWPQTTRAYQYGVYSSQVLQHYFMPSIGVITNLSPN